MAMFGYMTDINTVEETETQEIVAEGGEWPSPFPSHFPLPPPLPSPSPCSIHSSSVQLRIESGLPSAGDDLLSLLYHFLDEWLFLFSADPFFIPRVRNDSFMQAKCSQLLMKLFTGNTTPNHPGALSFVTARAGCSVLHPVEWQPVITLFTSYGSTPCEHLALETSGTVHHCMYDTASMWHYSAVCACHHCHSVILKLFYMREQSLISVSVTNAY